MMRRQIALAACLCLVPLASVRGQDTNSFGWSITPYLWATETSVDLTFRDANIGAGEISFNDLLDVLDAAFKAAEFKDGDLRLDYDYQGPMAGFNFRF